MVRDRASHGDVASSDGILAIAGRHRVGDIWTATGSSSRARSQSEKMINLNPRRSAGPCLGIRQGADVALFDLGASWEQEDTAEAIADRCRRYLKLTGEVFRRGGGRLRLDERRRGVDGAVSLVVSGAGDGQCTPGLHRCEHLWSEGLTDRPLRSEILPHNPLKKNHMSGCSAFCTSFIREKPCRVCSELIMG
jgi:hypothetical protein